jgi:hypothetical protein
MRPAAAQVHALILALGASLGLIATVCGDDSTLPQPYTRIAQPSPRHFRLEVASRRFQAPGKPDIWLAGMVHDGSPDFFLKVEDFLKTQPLVLLEDANNTLPNPPGKDATDEEKKKWTKQALEYAGEIVQGYHKEFKVYPESLDAVFFTLEPGSEWAFDLRTALTDGWGHPVAYKKTDDGYELSSDGAPGLTVTHTETWHWTNLDENRAEHADNLGLLEQSNGGLTFDHSNFLFCDMLVTEYDKRIKALPKEKAGSILSALYAAFHSPTTFNSKEYDDDVQVQRFLILEASGVPHIPQALHPEGEDRVTLTERNDVVWAELQRRIAANQPVCALYGAAHLYDLEQRLTGAGYAAVETRWLTPFEADLSKSKITDAQIAEIEDDAKTGRMGYY